MRRRKRAGRAHDKVHSRYWRAYRAQTTGNRKPSIFDDFRFIWADRTRRGAKRSLFQRIFRW